MTILQKVLLVCTSNERLGDTDMKTGAWAEEIAAPYYYFKLKGYRLTMASIRGGRVPLDPASLKGDNMTPVVKKFMGDEQAMLLLNTTESVVHLLGPDYDAIYVVGGHGIMWDGPYNPELNRLLVSAHMAGKLLAAVCHGPAALVGLSDRTGKPLVEGKQVTGFTNREEELVGKTGFVPFLLETKLRQLGAYFERAPAPWAPHAVRAGNLITGQNPASAQRVAEYVVEALSMGVRLTP